MKHFSKKLKFARLSCFHVPLSSLLFQLNPFWLELVYFITLSSLGFLSLKASKTTTLTTPLPPKDLDLFFTSVSAATVSSMSAVEMEVFSNTQLIFLTLLMFLGGEVFVSMLHLHLTRAKILNQNDRRSDIEMISIQEDEDEIVKLKYLAYLVSLYLLVAHTLGSSLIFLYLNLIPIARKVLKSKDINLLTFSVFTTVSSFSNCGFIPTNENMVVFKKSSGLLLILIPQLLIGNTLYPVFLRFLIWVVQKVTRREEYGYMLEKSREMGYSHLLSGLRCVYLGITVLGFVALQVVVFLVMEWSSDAVNGGGVNGYEKVVGSVFQVVNSRHSGESVFDLSAISPAILVLFIFMMYLPPYTSYLSIEKGEKNETSEEENKTISKGKHFMGHILFSQLTYLLIFIILICITERQKMKDDPLNFNVLNIAFEVISAYGNVGFSVGYSCERQMMMNNGDHGVCRDAWTGFVGRWSNAGKFVLILVMFFGKFKKFSNTSATPWILT